METIARTSLVSIMKREVNYREHTTEAAAFVAFARHLKCDTQAAARVGAAQMIKRVCRLRLIDHRKIDSSEYQVFAKLVLSSKKSFKFFSKSPQLSAGSTNCTHTPLLASSSFSQAIAFTALVLSRYFRVVSKYL